MLSKTEKSVTLLVLRIALDIDKTTSVCLFFFLGINLFGKSSTSDDISIDCS
jgi:hypothetical protein